MKKSTMLTARPSARRRAFRLLGLALLLLALALALPAGALAGAAGSGRAAAAPPAIRTFEPDRGAVGEIVTVWGSGLSGATLVELSHAPVPFAVLDDSRLQLTVPAGAVSGPVSVTTPGGSVVSKGSFTVTEPPPVITVIAPTGTGSYEQGSMLSVSWTTSTKLAHGEFGIGVRAPAGGWIIDLFFPAIGYTDYSTSLKLDVPAGIGYNALVAWRPVQGSGSWDVYSASPGSFTVHAANAITAFSFQGLTPPVIGVIDERAHTIALNVPRATDLHALVATFTTTGDSVAVGGAPQISGTTANDFSSPVTYTVAAADGSTRDYVVTVIPVLAIGDAYEGGVVAYLLQRRDPGYSATVQHGLIAATGDQAGWVIWALPLYQTSPVPEGTGGAIGTGSANTDKIIAQNGAGITYAAGLARAYTGGGYGDWYLPSKDELDTLWRNRYAVGGFMSARYWSSTEGSRWATAFCQNFGGGREYADPKSSAYGVRAVRAF